MLGFHFAGDLLCCAQGFRYYVVPLIYFFFYCFCLQHQIKEIVIKTYVNGITARNFMVSGLMFKSLTHFELIFVYSVKSQSFHFLIYGCAVFPTPFIEETVLSPLYILGSFVINELTIYVWVCFYTLYYVPLIYLFLCQYHLSHKAGETSNSL